MLERFLTSAAALRFRVSLWQSADREGKDRASRDDLEKLVEHQMGWWENKAPLRSMTDALHALNRRSLSAFVFSVKAGEIAVWPKPRTSFPAAERKIRHHQRHVFMTRAALYRVYLEHVLRRSSNDAAFDFALDVNDLPEDMPEIPVFGFQKHEAAHNILLPDVDFFHFDWYRNDGDPFVYEDKTATACFVGSSTGGWLNAEAVRNLLTPRLRAANYFRHHAAVVFRIARAAQCATPDVETLLRQQPYFGPPMAWRDQLRHRFLISMDGNGAACSRLARALRSNSVLIKFDSPFHLYYFAALEAGREYLPAESEAEVEHIVDTERAEPGRFKPIAQAGRQFSDRFLSAASVCDYASLLMARFAELQ